MASSEHLRHLLRETFQMWAYYFIALLTLLGGVFSFTASSGVKATCRITWAPIVLDCLIFLAFLGAIFILIYFYISRWRSSRVRIEVAAGPLCTLADAAQAAAASITAIHVAIRAVANAALGAAHACGLSGDIGTPIEIQSNLATAALCAANQAHAIANLLEQPQPPPPLQPQPQQQNLQQRLNALRQQVYVRLQRQENSAARQLHFILITGVIFAILLSSAFLGVVIRITVKVMCHH